VNARLSSRAPVKQVSVRGACTHNLKDIDVDFFREKITVVTGVSGSGKSSLVFDTVLQEAKHRFFSTLSHFGRGFFDMGERTAVRSITGLSLAISLEQNETAPSLRSTVGTLTNLSELLGVFWARFCKQACPKHFHSCSAIASVEDILSAIVAEFEGHKVAVVSPVAYSKKGLFKKEIEQARRSGFVTVVINDKHYDVDKKLPRFEPSKRYTVKFIHSYHTVKHNKTFGNAVKSALRMSQGRVELITESKEASLFSTTSGCPECGFSWPSLDGRYFSANSLGKCPTCDGIGTLDTEAIDVEVDGNLYNHSLGICPDCDGSGLDSKYDVLTINKKSLRSLYNMDLTDLYDFVLSARKNKVSEQTTWQSLLEEVSRELEKLLKLGLGHLSLGRRITGLSNGERQRLRLSSILIEPLRGVLYILDEPSQGLHPADLKAIWQNILTLKELGNTLIIIDHDSFFMHHADYIVELGPGGGRSGGHVVAAFAPKDAQSFVRKSLTAKMLAAGGTKSKSTKRSNLQSTSQSSQSFVSLSDVSYRYLDIKKLHIKKHAINVVSGVSGVGKTTLVMGVLAQNFAAWAEANQTKKKTSSTVTPRLWPLYCTDICGHEDILMSRLIDRKPMGKSTVSMPATYLDCMKFLRDLYAKLPASQVAGLQSSHFSLASDLGRCLYCQGKGFLRHSMKFLADAKEVCPRCHGKRYQDYILAITYKGYSLSDLLSLSLAEVADIFQHHKHLKQRLQPAVDLGLGYLIFGQPSISLSGGEAQRLKLARYLAKPHGKHEVFIMDEPTRGLHDQDVKLLLAALRNIVSLGSTVIIIEHHSHIIKNCDHLVDLGVGPGRKGGKLLYQGPPLQLLSNRSISSLTAQYMTAHS